MRRTARSFVIAAAILASLAAAAPAGAVDARRVARGLDAPVAFTFDDDGRIWYVEKDGGEIRIFDPSDDSDVPFVTVPGVNGEGERGLLGIALHPRYPAKPFVYVFATRSANGALRNQVLRYGDRNDDGVDRTVLVSSPASGSPYHNGGRIAFGPDGNLYVVVGDGHDPANAQDRRDERGKILRLAPNGDVPATNPFDNSVWAYGIRNSFGFAFDPETGRLWETENGPSCNDEINLIKKGGNYGWGPSQTCDGAAPRNTNQDGPDPILPRFLYGDPIAVTGIAFCDGCGLGARSQGALFHASANDGRITRLQLNAERDDVRSRAVVLDHGGSALSVEVGPNGRIYFSDFSAIYVLAR